MIRSMLPLWANRARSQRELIQKLHETHFTIFSPEKTKEDWGIYPSTSTLLPQRFRIAPRALTSYTLLCREDGRGYLRWRLSLPHLWGAGSPGRRHLHFNQSCSLWVPAVTVWRCSTRYHFPARGLVSSPNTHNSCTTCVADFTKGSG